MLKCAKCGQELVEGTTVCPSCGAPVSEGAVKTLPSMEFGTAVRTCLNKYATFTGRARRSEYWYFVLFNFIIDIVCGIIMLIPFIGIVISVLIGLALIIPGLAATVRRLHDSGKTGWLVLLGIIPVVGGIIVLVLTLVDSQQGENQYGPSTKYVAA